MNKKKLPPRLNREALEKIETITYFIYNSYVYLQYAKQDIETQFGCLFDEELNDIQDLRNKTFKMYENFLEILIDEKRKQEDKGDESNN